MTRINSVIRLNVSQTHQKKRKKTGGKYPGPTTSSKYWIYGKHSVFSALANPRRVIHGILLTENCKKQIPNNILPHLKGKHLELVKRITPDKDSSSQGIAAQVTRLIQPNLEDFLQMPHKKDIDENIRAHPLSTNRNIVIILDQVQDPHNIGAIMRSAAAFGATGVITSKHHAPSENATMIKIACGGFEMVPYIQVSNIACTISKLQEHGYFVAGLAEDAPTNLDQIDLAANQNIAIILGSEGSGIRSLVSKRANALYKIPILEQAKSINVSNAAAIALYALTTPYPR